jgi:trans-aconitate 2-methyltransferase
MLERAAEVVETAGAAGDGLRFAQGDIAEFREGGWDVVFSNAALHWLPDHAELFGRLAGLLNPGGQLAVQMPANHDHPSHVVAAEVAGDEPFRTALEGYHRVSPVQPPEWYADLLDRLGLADQHVRLQVYLHHLTSREEVVEWVKGTLLTDYESRMPAEVFEEFLGVYRERLLPRLEDTRPYRYPFKRLLLWGQRGSGEVGRRWDGVEGLLGFMSSTRTGPWRRSWAPFTQLARGITYGIVVPFWLSGTDVLSHGA